MRFPTWRMVLTGSAVVVLAAGGIGLAAAAAAPSSSTTDVLKTVSTPDPGGSAAPSRPLGRDRLDARAAWAPRLLRLGRHLVHAEVTVTDKDGQLVDLWLDHGTVQSIGGGSLTLSESGGGTETVKTDDATIVSLGRRDASLGDVQAGAEVFVQSRVIDGSALAKRILVIPARPS
jgi:hypothetical protein